MVLYSCHMGIKTIPWALIEELLAERNKSRDWLEQKLNVETNNISNWKKRGVPKGRAAEIAAALGTTSDYLLQIPGALKDAGTPLDFGAYVDASEGIEESPDRRIASRRATDLGASTGNEIVIPQYHGIGGSMGAGLILRDQPGEIQGWRVTPEWISKNVKNFTGAFNLRIVTGFGDSMRPLYNPGDPLLVDSGVKTVDFDSIYFFRIGDEGFIKRLQRVPGQGLLAISENKSYRDWTITPDMDFEVFARVIKVWCGSDF